MKSFSFVLAMVAMASSFAFAQPKSKSTPRYESRTSSWDSSQREGTAALRLNKGVVSGASSKDKITIQGGVYYYIPMKSPISLRTGGLLAMKDSEVEANGSSATINRLFIDVPGHVVIQASPVVAPYIGFDLGLKLSSSCSVSGASSCSITDEKSLVLQPVLGADFNLGDFKAGIAYELETEYSRNWKQTAFVFSGGMTF